MKTINNYIVEKLKINKDSKIRTDLRDITDKILFMCGWASACNEEDVENGIKPEFDGSFTAKHLNPEKDPDDAYVIAVDNWVHVNNVEKFVGLADHFELESYESNDYVVNMFENAPKRVKDIVDKMTDTQQAYKKHKVQINPKYYNKDIFLFTSEFALIWCDREVDNVNTTNLITRVFVKDND